MSSLRLVLACLVVIAACGGDDAANLDIANRDPRCVSACPETMQSIAGVGDVCDTTSRVQCLDACEARISGLMSTCQTCLTEDVCFNPGGCDDHESIGCNNGTATVTGWNGSCSYPCEDTAARTNCLKQVSPTREVACTAEFKPVTDCSTVCN